MGCPKSRVFFGTGPKIFQPLKRRHDGTQSDQKFKAGKRAGKDLNGTFGCKMKIATESLFSMLYEVTSLQTSSAALFSKPCLLELIIK